MLDVHGLMARLAVCRKAFHSEADFQHGLAWEIHKAHPNAQVRLEVNLMTDQRRRRYVDIWLPEAGIAIELKYLTQKLEVYQNGEAIELRNQGAQDLGRYNFLLDIERIESFRSVVDGCMGGYAVLLTNDPLYWEATRTMNTIDAALRLHEGRKLIGDLRWSDRAGAGTTRGRESPIRLMGSYRLSWQDYSQPNRDRYGKFRYLVVSVK